MFQTTNCWESRSTVPCRPPAAIVRVGDLTQELGIDVPRDQRSERPDVGERIAAQERDQDR
jgi:hypothetical protein